MTVHLCSSLIWIKVDRIYRPGETVSGVVQIRYLLQNIQYTHRKIMMTHICLATTQFLTWMASQCEIGMVAQWSIFECGRTGQAPALRAVVWGFRINVKCQPFGNVREDYQRA